MANSISARNAKNEYEKFVAAHENPNVVYGSHAGWGFPGTFSPVGFACSQGANLMLGRIAINHEESCADPAKIVNDIFGSVLEKIPDKPREKYRNLILSFKKIGQLKLNRLKKNRRFQEICNALSDPTIPAKQKKNLESEFSSLIKNTMKDILVHVPACTKKDNFEKFVFEETEIALNNAATARVNRENGTGTLVAESVVASPNNRGNGNGAATGTGTGTLVAETLPPIRAAAPQTLNQGTGTLIATPPASPNGSLNETFNQNGFYTPVANETAEVNEAPPKRNTYRSLNVSKLPKNITFKKNTAFTLEKRLDELQKHIEIAEESANPKNKKWLRNYGYDLRTQMIKNIKTKLNELAGEEENSNNNSVTSFKQLVVGGKKSKKTRKQRKHTKKYKKTRAHKRR